MTNTESSTTKLESSDCNTTTSVDTPITTKTNRYEIGSTEYRTILWRLELLQTGLSKINLQVFKHLSELGCCTRCCFRFLNQRDLSAYQESSLHLSHLLPFLLFNDKQKQQKLEKERQEKEKQESSTETQQEQSSTKENNDNKEESNDKPKVILATTDTTPVEKYDPNTFVEQEPFVCISCLGMLQNTNEPEFLEEFLGKMKNCGYQFVDYSLALSLPTSAAVREYSIWYHLKQTYPDLFKGASPIGNVVDIKEGIKWVLGPIIGRKLNFFFKHSSDFRANMILLHEETKDEHTFLIPPTNAYNNKSTKRTKVASKDSTASVNEMLSNMTMKRFIERGVVPPTKVTTKYHYTLDFDHAAVYLAGKYNKYVRDLSQTPWIDPEEYQSSIQELVCEHINDTFKCDSFTFTTSGREDIDVRMLGKGRPFFIEIMNPHKIFFKYNDFRSMEDKINSNTDKIKVSNLQIITKKQTNLIKDAEGSKQKDYRCVVWTSKPFQLSDLEVLKSLTNFELDQNTPVRVLHRRTLMVRKKKITRLEFQYISPHFFVLDVIGAQAGTYIKEFVHGDLGRTTPNIGSLLNCEADILQLDVMDVDLDFPPKQNQ
ncbi:hypothetical protein CYY_001215 [Polysphondylium violaceum]|uniref:tRNA pseudouridine(55) synthase n=1 Tax=Polysphondylium violaceum TaxID=133409 RepID=A0A8J4Q9P9_9MYCE|nr:hypothetical protein CYY_001215 [Polysphondylium violaceum]